MTKFYTSVVLCCLLSFITRAQDFSLDSHLLYIAKATQTHEVTYQQVLAQFNQHIAAHPADIISIIEKCRFIEVYSYDESGMLYFDSIDQDLVDCEQQLQNFDEQHPERLLKKLSDTWGKEETLEIYHDAQITDLSTWQDTQLNRLYQSMHNKNKWDDGYDHQYAHLGYQINQEHDFLLGAAQYQMAIGDKQAAQQLITDYQFKTTEQQNELIKLYLSLNMRQQLTELYQNINKDEIDKALLFKIRTLLEQDFIADQTTLEDIKAVWNGDETLVELFDFSLSHKRYDIAHSIYDFSSQRDFWLDPFKQKKFTLYQQSQKWIFDKQDIYATMMWLLLIVIPILLMFIIIGPIHYRGLYKRVHNKPISASMTDWTLKHALYLGALFLMIDLVLLVIYEHDYFIQLFVSEDDIEMPQTSGVQSTMYFLKNFSFLFFALLIIKKGWGLFTVNSTRTLFKSLTNTLFIFIGFKIIAGLFFSTFNFINISAAVDPIMLVIEDILSNHGRLAVFLSIALLTPIVEEYLFRGVLLNSFNKHLSFHWANIIQALLFALIHDNMDFFFHHFALGVIAGILVRNHKHLYGAIALHILNNALAIVVLLS